MRLKGKQKPTQIIVGLVDKFIFNNSKLARQLSGHPKQGRVYRILKDDIDNSDESLYRLHIGDSENEGHLDGILLGTTLKGNHYDQWEYDIIELTPENYINHPIDAQDLEKIIEWFDTDNADLKELLEADINLVSDAEQIPSSDEDHYEKIFDSQQAQAHPDDPLEKELKRMFSTLGKELAYDQILEQMANHLDSIVNSSQDKTRALVLFLEDIADNTNLFSESFIKNSDTDESFISSILTVLNTHKVKDKQAIIEIMRYCLAELQRLNKK